MAKKTSVFLIKMKGSDARDCPFALVPKFQKDIDRVAKIKGDCEASLWQYRNLKFHRKLFGIANNIANDEFFQMMLSQWEEIKQVFNIQLNLSSEAVQSIRLENNNDGYSLIYICKAIFLPWQKETLPTGIVIYRVSSISFREMDNIEFEEFYIKCLDLFAFILNCPRNELENEFNY